MALTAVMSRGPWAGKSRAPSMKVPPGVPRSSSPMPARRGQQPGMRPADRGVGHHQFARRAAALAGQRYRPPGRRRRRASPRRRPASSRAGRPAPWRAARGRPATAGRAPAGAPDGAAAGAPTAASRATPSRGQRMKANTQSRISDTTEPMPVSVSRIAAAPAQPGRPALSAMRQHIQAASTSATSGEGAGQPEQAEDGGEIEAHHGRVHRRLAFAVRPIAEGQDRHDDERSRSPARDGTATAGPSSPRARRCASSARSAAARTAHARPGAPSGRTC